MAYVGGKGMSEGQEKGYVNVHLHTHIFKNKNLCTEKATPCSMIYLFCVLMAPLISEDTSRG